MSGLEEESRIGKAGTLEAQFTRLDLGAPIETTNGSN